jgi:hypothetical protein
MKSMAKTIGLWGVLGVASLSWGAGAGTSAGDFLTLGAGSRLAGMGGGGTALIDDASTLYWNPGAMTSVPKKSAVLMHTAYLESTSYSQASYVQNFGRLGAGGISFNYFSSGDIDKKDTSGADSGSFSPNDMAVTLGYAKTVGPVSLGGGVKYVKTTIVDSASTFALDLGLESKPLLNDKLRLAATAYNLGGTLTYDQEAEDLPQEFRLGAAYQITKKVSLVLDGASPKSGDTYFAGGAEYKHSWGDQWGLGARAGYSTRTAGDVSGLTGVTFGLGVSRGAFGLDYALVPQGDLGITHWMALVYRE